MSNAFIQALLMDDPDAGGGGGGAWPDPPGGGDPPDPGLGPTGPCDALLTDVEFVFLGEGPADGTQTNPVSGTLTKNEATGVLQPIGDTAPYDTGNLAASTAGMPFGSSWIRHPGPVNSRNFFAGPTSGYKHPRIAPFCFDGWYQLDSLTDWVCLAGDDSAFGGGRYNWLIDVNTTGLVTFQVRTGAPLSGTTALVQTGVGAVTAGVPFHIEAWGDGAGTIGLAFNGVQRPTTACAAATLDTSAGAVYLGAQNVRVPGFERVITGYSKGLRFTNAVRNTTDFTPPASLADYGLCVHGGTYSCISPEIGNKAAYTASTVGEGYTGNKDIFSDVVTPYGDGIIIGPSTVPTASSMYKAIPAGDCTYISLKFMVPSLTPSDDCGNLYAGQGHLGAGMLFSVIFAREAFFDGLRRPRLDVRSLTTDSFTSVSIGTVSPTAGQWYTLKLQIDAGIATYSVRTSDTDVLWASGTLPGSSWTPLDINTFVLWNDANVNTGTAHVAALRLCGYAGPAIPGTEKLTGIGMTATAGDVNSPAGFRRLTGQSMTAAAGSVSVFNANRTVALTGQSLAMSRGSLAYLPYPNLISETIDLNPFPTWGALLVTFLNDGTYRIEEVAYDYFGKFTYTGRWIDDSEIVETAIAHQYRCAALTNYGDGSPVLDTGVPGALGQVSVVFTLPPTFVQYVDFSVSIVPRVGNPRYGEIGYIGTFRISLPVYFTLPP